MGEIAEMMLDGTLCEGCGAYIGDSGDGIPRYCSRECARDRGALECRPAQKPAYTPPDPNSNRSKKRAARQFQQALKERAERGYGSKR